MSFRYVLAATDISSRVNSQHKVFARYRGKTAKKIYRCGKEILLTGGLTVPLAFAVKKIGFELSSGFVKSAASSAAEGLIGYVSGVGFVRWIYKTASVGIAKAYARVGYNILGLPITIYCRGANAALYIVQIDYIEEKWFGEKVYIFDDNRIWIGKNFTLRNAFNILEDEN